MLSSSFGGSHPLHAKMDEDKEGETPGGGKRGQKRCGGKEGFRRSVASCSLTQFVVTLPSAE